MVRRFIILLLLLVAGIAVVDAKVVLSVGDAVGAPGEKSSIEILLSNDADVVALQFNLRLPAGVEVDGEVVHNQERASRHNTVCRRKSDGSYMLMTTSASNQPFDGRTGTILSLPVIIRSGVEEGKPLPIVISDAVAASPAGDNILTSTEDGTLTVAKSPDLKVFDVAVNSSKAMPGEKLSVSWRVINHGETSTHAGWSEEILLVDAAGSTHRMGITNYSGVLSAGETVVRGAEPVIGEIPMIDGECHVKVRLIPEKTCGEPAHLKGDNEEISGESVEVGHRLTVSAGSVTVDEGNGRPVVVKVSRSGNLTRDLTLHMKGVEDSRYSLPEVAVIPAGKTSVEISIVPVANGKPDAVSVSTLNIGNEEEGYASVPVIINTVDDKLPTLTLDAGWDSMSEGETLKMTVSTDLVRDIDIPVTIVADRSAGVTFPASVVLPAGQSEVSFSLHYPDNNQIQGERDLTIKASAEGYDSEEYILFLKDDDIPVLTLELTHPGLPEGAGVVAATATIRREGATDNKLTIELTDDSAGRLFLTSNRVTIPAGQSEATVMFGPVDNSEADGDLVCTLTAAVVIPGCSCSVGVHETAGRVSAPFEIYDNDGPRLTFGIPASYVKEGGSMEVTLARNTPVGSLLPVMLTATPDGILELPAMVEMPADAVRMGISVKALPNHTADDSREVVITAVADGHSKASVRLAVTDNTLPDAIVKSIKTDSKDYFPADSVMMRLTVGNIGSGELPGSTPVEVYLRETGELVGVCYTPTVLAPEEEVDITVPVIMPGRVGRFNYYAIVNRDRKVNELTYDNNTLMGGEISVVSPFSAKVSTDRNSYVAGEEIHIKGSVSGRFSEGEKVEVYVVNNGYRHAISTDLSASGSFETVYTPYYGQTGRFAVGACHPGEGCHEELATFDIPAILRVATGNTTLETTPGETMDGKLKLRNPAGISVNGLEVRIESPSGITAEVNLPSTEIAPESTIEVDYSIVSGRVTPGDDWEETYVVFSADNAAELRYPIYLYCRNPQGEIDSDLKNIDIAIQKGGVRTLTLTLTNKGAGETGVISPSLPTWMKPGVSRLPSIPGGGTATINLTMAPTGNVGGRHTGILYFNCESGNSLGIPFNVEIAASGEGQLSVDVCDNNTYGFGMEPTGPHVAGADIVLRNSVTGQPVASGKSDGDGRWEVTLPEGTYDMTVSEPMHQTRTLKVSVEPGRRAEKTANLLLRTVDISYTAEETEVEDQYEINIETTYQTNVPMPVVVIEQLDRVDGDNMYPGETKMIRLEVSNKGLMRAEEFTLMMQKDVPGWTITPAYDLTPFPIEAGESVIIPIMVTLNDANLNDPAKVPMYGPESTEAACIANYASLYKVVCGTEMPENGAFHRLALSSCSRAAVYQNYFGGFTGDGVIGGLVENIIDWFMDVFLDTRTRPGNSSPHSVLDDYRELNSLINRTFCDHCTAEFAGHIVETASEQVPTQPYLESGYGVLKTNYDMQKLRVNPNDRDLQMTVANDIIDVSRNTTTVIHRNQEHHNNQGGNVGALITIGYNFGRLAHRYFMTAEQARQDKECYDPDQFNDSRSVPDWLNSYERVTTRLAEGCSDIHEAELNIFGDEIWTERGHEDMTAFADSLSKLTPEGYFDPEKALAARPPHVTEAQVLALVERWNNTLFNLDPTSTNRIDFTTLNTIADELEHRENEAVAEGYESTAHRYESEVSKVMNILDFEEQSVCASVSLRFTQRMQMTRQAFRGTLTVNNGHTEIPVTDFRFYPTVQTIEGEDATAKEFQINMESLEGFSGDLAGDGAGWTLAAGEEGTATVVYIPTRYAAPEETTPWNFGGTVSYVDPYSGNYTSMTLPFVTLGVSPSPLLTLDYFLQRDVLGDDPLTDETEPTEEAEFSLMIRNLGAGVAKNVAINALAPEIIDNRKGLLIDFNLTGGEVDGEERVLPLDGNVPVQIGDIPAHGNKVIRWWLTSPLLGHFASYSAGYNHLTSYDNPDLSLVEGVNVHELIRSVNAPGGERVFLANEDVDSDDTPDRIFSPDGGQFRVEGASTTFSMTGDDAGSLEVTGNGSGWVYGNVKDPTYGTQSLIRVVRKSDNKEMSLRNFWQTDRTLRDGIEPLYENRIHFADSVTSGRESYLLCFGPKQGEPLRVVEVTGLPEDGIAPAQIGELQIRFSAPILWSNEKTSAITLTCGIDTVPASGYSVALAGADTLSLTFSDSGEARQKGLYTLSVDTSGLSDTDGASGGFTQKYSWTVTGGSPVSICYAAEPQEAGEVKCLVEPLFGEEAKYLAEASEGWNFTEWLFDGNHAGDKPQFTFTALSEGELVARFTRVVHQVEISPAEGGRVEGNPGGYSHGTILTLRAIPSAGYEFEKWIIMTEDEKVTEIPDFVQTEIVVDKAMTVIPVFRRVIFTHKLTLAKGWNWISSPLDVQEFPASRLTEVIGDDETPTMFTSGKMLKVRTNSSMLLPLEGREGFVETLTLPVAKGSNRIGHPFKEEVELNASLYGVSEGDILAGQRGFAEYTGGLWHGDLKTLRPGEGYILYSGEGGTLRFSGVSGEIGSSQIEVSPAAAEYQKAMQLTMRPVDTGGNTLRLNPETVVNISCGGAQRGCGIPSGDIVRMNIFGSDGESLLLEIVYGGEDNQDNTPQPRYACVDFSEGPSGRTGAPVDVIFRESVSIDELTAQGEMVTVYNLSGICLLKDAPVRTLSKLPPGIYLVNGRLLRNN